MEMKQTYLDSFNESDKLTKVATVATTSKPKHSRRCTESSYGKKQGAVKITSSSWGSSMIDFTSIFFPIRNWEAHNVHRVRSVELSPAHCQQTRHISPTMFNSNVASPSTTSCSVDGDDDYDSSNSSDAHYMGNSHKHQRLEGPFCIRSVDEIGYSTEKCMSGSNNSQIPNESGDKNMASNNLPHDTTAVAERWISMASPSLSEKSSPNTLRQLYHRQCSEEKVEVSIMEYSDRDEFVSSHHGAGRNSREFTVWNRNSAESTANIQSTPRGTCTRNFLENFHDGTQCGMSARYNDFSISHPEPQHSAAVNIHSTLRLDVDSAEHHPSSNNCISSTQVPQKLVTEEEYTTSESTSSRYSNQSNGSQSSISSHRSTSTAGDREGKRIKESTGNDMTEGADDDNDNYSSSDNEDNEESDLDYEDVEEEEKLRKEAALWKTAVDPKSGRTYYFHTQTRETQWRKPLCCATVAERRAAIKKEKQTLAFFASMEQNILRTMQEQQEKQRASNSATRSHSVLETSSASKRHEKSSSAVSQNRRDSEPLLSLQNPFKLVRTISTMEDSVLAALVQRVPSFRNATIGSGDGSHFTPVSRQHNWNSSANSSLNDVSAHHVLSPIREASNESQFGNSTASSLQHQQSLSDYQVVTNDCEIESKGTEDRSLRLTMRENSLPFGAIVAASQSRRQHDNDDSDGNSLNLSELVRMNSSTAVNNIAHNSNHHFNQFDYIPEGENEDNSESCSNHNDNCDVSPSRGGNSLSRQSGFINLTKVGFILPDDDDGVLEDLNGEGSFRQSLQRTTGKISLDVNLKESISRENSLDLTQLTGGSRRMIRDPSMSLQSEAYWGSYLSESAIRGLSVDEGEAMVELASITDQMASIRSFSSDSSSSSVEDGKEPSENIHPSLNTAEAVVSESNEMDSSENNVWNSTPQMTAKQARRDSTITSRPSMIRPASLRNAPSRAILEDLSEKKNVMMEKPSMLRRNTCGTLYVGSTLSAPDKDATMKCVCAVYRAHILQSIIGENTYFNDTHDDKFRVFNDLVVEDQNADFRQPAIPPTLEDITIFYRDVFSRAQMESDCIIISLIYVERLIKVTDGALRPRVTNWRSILFSCMVMASKVWDDLSMWNADFSHTCPAGVEFELSRINELEIAMLSSLQYKVKVPAGEYAKYYFLLRSMLIKSGLGSDDLKTMNPLDVEGAKQLQHISSQYQSSVASMSERQQASMGRSKTTGSTQASYPNTIGGGYHSDSSNSETPPISPIGDTQQRCKVGLEHMVKL
jgi:WW domain/Cyclin, N-terminal domain